jgi:hypothetical protein
MEKQKMKKDQHDESVISKMETQQREKSADSGGSNLSPGSKIDSQIMNIGMRYTERMVLCRFCPPLQRTSEMEILLG